jgi:hypothetical protein
MNLKRRVRTVHGRACADKTYQYIIKTSSYVILRLIPSELPYTEHEEIFTHFIISVIRIYLKVLLVNAANFFLFSPTKTLLFLFPNRLRKQAEKGD